MSDTYFETRKPKAMILFFGVLTLICLAGVVALLYAWKLEGDEGYAYGAVFAGLLTVLCVVVLYRLEVYRIYPDRIQVKLWWGKPLHEWKFNELTGWSEQIGRSQYGTFFRLRLYGEAKTLKIESGLTPDYQQIKAFIQKILPENTMIEVRRMIKLKRVMLVVLFVLINVTLFGTIYFVQHQEDVLSATDLVEVKGILEWGPKHVQDSDNPQLRFGITKYPSLTCMISGFSYDVCDVQSFINGIGKGDSLFMWVERDDYDVRITGQQRPGLLDVARMEILNVQTIADESITYIELVELQHALAENNRWGLILCAVFDALFLFLFGYQLFEIRKLKRQLAESRQNN
ncbi:MAG: hypothetical protein H6608_04700 [Flavobacteriales bacterium]|nr:hypothetical protein [Flavobacteriales bacterium]